MITELRKELRVSDDEHRELLAQVNAEEIITKIRYLCFYVILGFIWEVVEVQCVFIHCLISRVLHYKKRYCYQGFKRRKR